MEAGNIVLANNSSDDSVIGFNNLFLRLENLRIIHNNAIGQTYTGISSSFPTSVAQIETLANANIVNTLNDELNILKNSTWDESNGVTGNLGIKYPNNFSVPSIGELLKAADFNTLNTEMTALEGICPVYSSQYSTRYSNAYGNAYSAQYSAEYSAEYSNKYNLKYSEQYSSRYSGRYSGQYSSKYSGQYSGRYSGQYSSRYGGQYSGRYAGRYMNAYGAYSSRYSRYANKGRW